jgi:hypothetical protein
MGSAVRSGKTFERAWDRFVLAWPFSHVAVVLGPPCADPSAAGLADAIRNANEAAEGILAGRDRKISPLQGFSAAPDDSTGVSTNAVARH